MTNSLFDFMVKSSWHPFTVNANVNMYVYSVWYAHCWLILNRSAKSFFLLRREKRKEVLPQIHYFIHPLFPWCLKLVPMLWVCCRDFSIGHTKHSQFGLYNRSKKLCMLMALNYCLLSAILMISRIDTVFWEQAAECWRFLFRSHK